MPSNFRALDFIGRREWMAGAGAALATLPIVSTARAQTAGVALVIGNSKYLWEAALPNVRRDAPDIAKRLQEFGFKTELVQDAGKAALSAALEKFKAAANGASCVVFYFAGHGASWEKDTYLVPVDSDLSDPKAVQGLIPVSAISAAVKGAANRLIIFDNCRNNPADGWRQQAAARAANINPDQLRAKMADADTNSLTVYSTAPGRIALDGPAGDNSPFAAAFLRQLSGPSLDVTALPVKLRRDVLVATGGRQVIWEQSTFQQPYSISRSGKGGTAPVQRADPPGIVELRNAYTFARENNLPYPEGLIAVRPPGNSPHSQKVGSFAFTSETSVGPSPYLFTVLSVDDQGTAEIVTTIKNNAGARWRYLTGNVSGSRLSYVSALGRPAYTFDWSDANSGSVAQTPPSDGSRAGAGPIYNTRFKRLD